MADQDLPTADELRQLFVYDPETGVLRWQARAPSYYAHLTDSKANASAKAFNRKRAGKEAGGFSPAGYRLAYAQGRLIPSHRVAWCMYYGDWPAGQIDHIDGDRANNRINNLRVVTIAVNLRNREYKPRGRSGVVGVYWHKRSRKWQARLYLKDRAPYFGNYDTVEEAERAITIARKALGFNDRR